MDRRTAESLMVEIYLDRTVPDLADSVRQLPHEFFQTINKVVRVDTFRIENSDFRYFETAIDGSRPGTIQFANTHIGVYNLTNDSLLMARPCWYSGWALLFDAARRSAGRTTVR